MQLSVNAKHSVLLFLIFFYIQCELHVENGYSVLPCHETFACEYTKFSYAMDPIDSGGESDDTVAAFDVCN